MSIRVRIVLIVLPLIITSLLIAEVITSLYARNGITMIATRFLQFKTEELRNYATSQWTMLVDNDLAQNDDFIEASQAAIESFAVSLIRNDTEMILAINADGSVVMQTNEISVSQESREFFRRIAREDVRGWQQFTLSGTTRVAWINYFEPFNWYFLVTEERDTFYAAVTQIFIITAIVIAVASGISTVLLLIFSHYLTLPLSNVVTAMKDIISTSDLSKRVEIIYKDETGELAHSFNLMIEELEKAYEEIKGYALKAVIAQHKEQKIRNIFQKYVPTDVIDQFFTNPEAMLVGEDRVLAVLFSDIRSFTSISELLMPHELVESLNKYFSRMVEIIMNRNGIVDKYIGDAIMAFFGAPVHHEDDALQSTFAALEMLEGLREFNTEQAAAGRPEFNIGIGINYGLVTVGNIGSERKMDYTVIGDMVNLASRLEGLTKKYHQGLIVSESLKEAAVHESVQFRLLDRVIVKGKKQGVGIYTAKLKLSDAEREGWEMYQEGLNCYFERQFPKAAAMFSDVLRVMPDDFCAQLFYNRSEEYLLSPPGDDWTGLTTMTEK